MMSALSEGYAIKSLFLQMYVRDVTSFHKNIFITQSSYFWRHPIMTLFTLGVLKNHSGTWSKTLLCLIMLRKRMCVMLKKIWNDKDLCGMIDVSDEVIQINKNDLLRVRVCCLLSLMLDFYLTHLFLGDCIFMLLQSVLYCLLQGF